MTRPPRFIAVAVAVAVAAAAVAATVTALVTRSSGPAPAASALVCTLPAAGCGGPGGGQDMKTAPTRIVNSGDGAAYLTKLAWSGWGDPTAIGHGTLKLDNCEPDCASGRYTGYPVKVTLSTLTHYGSGPPAYAVMVVSAPTSPYPGAERYSTGMVP